MAKEKRDLQYLENLDQWFESCNVVIRKTKSSIASAKEEIKHSEAIIKVETAYLKTLQKRVSLAKTERTLYLKRTKK